MNQINIAAIRTVYGYKNIELLHGNLCSTDLQAECLVISAYKGIYDPVPDTLICELEKSYPLIIRDIAASAAIDLRPGLRTWISREISGTPFKRIACVEMAEKDSSGDVNVQQAIIDLFSLFAVCETNKLKIGSIAMPLIGTGNQKIPVQEVVSPLLDHAIGALHSIGTLQHIRLVEKVSGNKLEALDDAVNQYLRRDDKQKEAIAHHQSFGVVKDEIRSDLLKIQSMMPVPGAIGEYLDKLDDSRLRLFEICILGRRIIELMLNDLGYLNPNNKELSRAISALTYNPRTPAWVISYLHLIRVSGNHFAHASDTLSPGQKTFDRSDGLLAMMALNRVLDFWIAVKQNGIRL